MKEEERILKEAVCAVCGLPAGVQVRVRDLGRCCPRCGVREMIRLDKLTTKEVVEMSYARDICAYCGEAAEHTEHVIPRRLAKNKYTVRSCAECNLVAGGFPSLSFYEKREEIRKRLRRRYKKLIEMPEWDEEELGELRGNMYTYVKGSMLLKGIVEARLEFDILFEHLGLPVEYEEDSGE